jgi:hypothetical protein
MKAYITTKVVLAEPQDDPKSQVSIPGYKVVYPDGYESWCPKEVFERTSRPFIATEKSLIFQETVLVEEPVEEAVEDEGETAGE